MLNANKLTWSQNLSYGLGLLFMLSIEALLIYAFLSSIPCQDNPSYREQNPSSCVLPWGPIAAGWAIGTVGAFAALPYKIAMLEQEFMLAPGD